METINPNPYPLAYGSSYLRLALDSSLSTDIISPMEIPSANNPVEIITQSLKHPLNELDLAQFKNIKSVAIAVNDKTRPVPHQFMLPPLLEKLYSLGITAQNIKLIIATGTHKPMVEEEYERILPADIYKNYPVCSHNCDDNENLEYLGETSRKTPVLINRQFLDADLRIVLGNIEPHHFMGFSGGAKSMSIGLAGRETINKNHAMLTDPKATIGEYENNPMRQDVEEIGQIAGLQYAENVILNHKKEIVNAYSGAPLVVMKAGIEEVRRTGQVSIKSLYDVVIASAGGAPKDINLYQSQKAITHAAMCVRDGGAVILAAKCPEGSGSAAFEEFMQGVATFEEVFRRFKRDGFRVGPHKAFQIARLASRVSLIMVSDIPDELVRNWFITPAHDLDQAFQIARRTISPLRKIAIMPRATNTIPYLLGGL
jgi:lactate racemase